MAPTARSPRHTRWQRRVIIVTLIALVTVFALLCTRAGIWAAFGLGAFGHTSLATSYLHAMEYANHGRSLGLAAHQMEVFFLSPASGRRTQSDHLLDNAADRYIAAALEAGDTDWRADAFYRKAQILAERHQYDEAVSVLTAATGYSDAIQRAPYTAVRIKWLTDGGHYERAISEFRDFAEQGSRRGSDRAVKSVWKAYRLSGREREGRRYLLGLWQLHRHQPLGMSIARELSLEDGSAPP